MSSTTFDAGAAAAVPGPTSAQHFRFSGTTGEYFGIWIVNLLLTVVTFGIYSAWAKVRTRRYFYRHTSFAGERFDYHARPTAILIGRLIGAALGGVYLATAWLAPGFELIPLALIFLATPWLLLKGARFNARNSSYRNVRFSFHGGGLGEAYLAFVGWPILGALSLGLAMPYSFHRQARWKLDNHRFGSLPFRFDTRSGPYFGMYWMMIGLTVLGIIGMMVMMAVSMMFVSESLPAQGEEPSAAFALALAPAYVVLLLGYTLAGAYFMARSMKLGLGTTTLDGHPFSVRVRARDVMWLYVSNTLVILITLGLALPWAKVRAARYQLERIALDIDEASIQRVVAERSAQTSAIGQEVGEAFDVEFDFGL
ncbi:MAG: YjgN family protein [Pseudomonadota bacterium]